MLREAAKKVVCAKVFFFYFARNLCSSVLYASLGFCVSSRSAFSFFGRTHMLVWVVLAHHLAVLGFNFSSIRSWSPLKSGIGARHLVPPDANSLSQALRHFGDRVAAVVIEPMLQAAAACWCICRRFLEAARFVCDHPGLSPARLRVPQAKRANRRRGGKSGLQAVPTPSFTSGEVTTLHLRVC